MKSYPKQKKFDENHRIFSILQLNPIDLKKRSVFYFIRNSPTSFFEYF